jgi:hypothetical protein
MCSPSQKAWAVSFSPPSFPLATDISPRPALLFRVRLCIVLFMIGLIISGATAVPLEWELRLLLRGLHAIMGENAAAKSALIAWMQQVYDAIHQINHQYPFIAYGFDWLAFGHFAIAIAFIGPWLDPVRNRWVLRFGMICCLAVVPYAFIFGQFRGIPIYWRLIDCSFGAIGLPLLWYADRCAGRLAYDGSLALE